MKKNVGEFDVGLTYEELLVITRTLYEYRDSKLSRLIDKLDALIDDIEEDDTPNRWREQ